VLRSSRWVRDGLRWPDGDLDWVISVLQKRVTKMSTNVRLPNNYFEALVQKRQLDRVTNRSMRSLAPRTARSSNSRSSAVAPYLQQQHLAAGAARQ
jgi:hypothetical protein